MELYLSTSGIDRYKSNSQRARVSTEPWGAANLFCPACESPRINPLPTGTQAADFACPSCKSRYQLKSSAKRFGSRVLDGAYAAMHRAIVGDQTPDLFLLHYKVPQLVVESVLVIPHFAFSLSCVEKRKALSPSAVRKGYVGCYFLLDRIPVDAKIPVVEFGKPVSPASVRKAYNKVRPLEKLNIEKRGWTLDVLNVVRSLKKNEFVLSEVYDHADQLAELHPQNHHIHDKIRQQLQELRKLGFLTFESPGHYTLR